MTAAHVAAAAVSAWWLRRGERAVWELAGKVVTVAVRLVHALVSAPAPLSPPSRRHPRALPLPGPSGAILRYTVVRRGPPSHSTALA
jgi:hypothetical protein